MIVIENKMNGFEKVSDEEIVKKYPDMNVENFEFIKPSRSDIGSAGYDFFAPTDFVVYPGGGKTLIWTGFKVKLLQQLVLLLDTRSGNGTKKDITLANTIGVIDSSYYNNPDNEGHIGIMLKNNGNEPFYVKKGDHFAQGIITQYFTTDDDVPRSIDRIGGFGSTTKK